MTGPTAEEVTGYMDVKVPAVVRRRGLTPWKAWRRQWCAVRRSTLAGSTLEVQIGHSEENKLQVATKHCTLWRTQSRSKQFAFGVFCGLPGVQDQKKPILFLAGRTETESQMWVRCIRQLLTPHFTHEEAALDGYPVSLIDNDFTQAAGLTGVYGTLRVTAQEVTINDPGSDEVKVTWDWLHLQQFHLATNGKAEDEGKICVIHTSREFKGGAGNIHLFCEDAPQLLQSLLSGGRLKRLLLSPLPSPPLSLLSARRLSRSENDIRFSWNNDGIKTTPKSSSIAINLRRKRFTFRSHSSEKRSSTISDEGLVNRTASSLISASLGLMFSTPGCSEADSESIHEYQQVGFNGSNEDLVGDLIGMVKYRTQRRESGISVASGIYEEIPDIVFPPDIQDEVLYTNSVNISSPPPLPPRRRHIFKKVDSGCFSGISSPKLDLTPPDWDVGSARSRFLWPMETSVNVTTVPEPDYLPMSPGLGFNRSAHIEQSDEDLYMVMSSIDTL